MAETVMVLAAHPDDAELGMGGTIAALSAAGHKVIVVDLTDGEPTPHGTLELRQAETAAASKVLGIAHRVTLDIKNREIFDTVENRKKVATVIREFKPSILFAHYADDSHPDHIEASALSIAARFYAKFVKTEMPHDPHFPRKIFHYLAVHLRVKVIPTFIFDISNHIDAKMASIAAYASQFSANTKNVGVPDLVKAEAAYWGMQAGTKYGEPFICREQIKLSSVESLLYA